MQKIAICYHRTILSGYIFATKASINNRKKLVKQQYLPHMFLQYGKLRPTSGWDRFVSLGHPTNFNGFHVLAALLHSHAAALNRRRHLYSAGRPSRWALAHIFSYCMFYDDYYYCCCCYKHCFLFMRNTLCLKNVYILLPDHTVIWRGTYYGRPICNRADHYIFAL